MSEFKFIVSARALWMMMEKERDFDLDDSGYRTMKVENGKCHFNAIAEIDVEAKSEGEIELSKQQFKRLRKVVRALPDQPIVLYVSGHTLYIHNICF